MRAIPGSAARHNGEEAQGQGARDAGSGARLPQKAGGGESEGRASGAEGTVSVWMMKREEAELRRQMAFEEHLALLRRQVRGAHMLC